MATNMRFILIGLFLLGVTNAFSAPSNTISVPNTFTAQTVISSSQTNANNNEVQSKYNAHTHTDITQTGTITTGVWNGTKVSTQYGGTGQDLSAVASGAVVYLNNTGTVGTLAEGTPGQTLQMGVNNAPQWNTVASVGLGAWDGTKTAGTHYQATTDGFVTAYTSNGSVGKTLTGYTDAGNPTTVVRAQVACGSGTLAQIGTVMFPVKKNDYWEVTISGGSETATVYFIPLS